MKYARLTLSLLAAGLLAACSSAPSTDGQGAAVEDRSSASASGVGGSGVTTVNADGKLAGAAYPELKDPKSLTPTALDVVKNPKKLKFRELEAATLPRVLAQVDLTLINTNYALAAKLNPAKDALVIEGSESPYVNILVSRTDNQDAPAMKKLAAALMSPEVKRFIQDKYKGAVVPAF